MLRIISSKLALTQTPGDLSIPSSDQQVLQPYKTVRDYVKRRWQKHRQDKLRNQPYGFLSRYEQTRDPANGTCPNCGQPKGRDERGTRFCPSPECNISRPQLRR